MKSTPRATKEITPEPDAAIDKHPSVDEDKLT